MQNVPRGSFDRPCCPPPVVDAFRQLSGIPQYPVVLLLVYPPVIVSRARQEVQVDDIVVSVPLILRPLLVPASIGEQAAAKNLASRPDHLAASLVAAVRRKMRLVLAGIAYSDNRREKLLRAVSDDEFAVN